MKRVFLLFLMCVGFCILSQATTYTKTIQVGETFTISPIRPWGSSNSYYANAYESSNPNVVGISVENDGTTTVGSITYNEFKFVVIGQQSGTTIVTIGYKGSDSNRIIRGDATYIITVVDVKSISIPNELSLFVGDSYTFSPIIADNGVQTTLTWQSSNNAVATVDANGLLTTTGTGTATITCMAHNGVSAQCMVSVNPVLTNSITLNETEAEMKVGDRLQLEATVAPEDVTDGSLNWISTNKNVAFVSETGRVIAVGPGFCQIKATANDGSGKTASCLVEVTGTQHVPGDMNGDGRVTVTDAVKVIDIILENE